MKLPRGPLKVILPLDSVYVENYLRLRARGKRFRPVVAVVSPPETEGGKPTVHYGFAADIPKARLRYVIKAPPYPWLPRELQRTYVWLETNGEVDLQTEYGYEESNVEAETRP